MEEVTRSGESWLQLTIERRSSGLIVFVKTDPRVELFMAGLGTGPAIPLESFGRNWVGESPILVYKKDQAIHGTTYTVDPVCGELVTEGMGPTNLSFLRFVGVGGDGIRFGIAGPYSKEGIRSITRNIIVNARKLFEEYIAPVTVTLSISSKEA